MFGRSEHQRRSHPRKTALACWWIGYRCFLDTLVWRLQAILRRLLRYVRKQHSDFRRELVVFDLSGFNRTAPIPPRATCHQNLMAGMTRIDEGWTVEAPPNSDEDLDASSEIRMW